jgi:hypothetical protein
MCPNVESTRSKFPSSKGKIFRVAFSPLDIEPFGLCPCLSFLEELGHKVDRGNSGAGARRRQGGVGPLTVPAQVCRPAPGTGSRHER